MPTLIDFSTPDYAAFSGLDAAKVLAALKADEDRLHRLGYDVQMCLTDFGETAEAVVLEHLKRQAVRLRPHRRRCANDPETLHLV